ncbi:hypothetical protein HW555_004565 [Spodoptera exigua]|uniref:Uncharacterized protein n=1 Tax=Spodoptera exigua TaxID=7107 RepID=A0A835GLL6_SPOEX|nr:hypothetical protein HW555_004565 [Spodoptera exigua]
MEIDESGLLTGYETCEEAFMAQRNSLRPFHGDSIKQFQHLNVNSSSHNPVSVMRNASTDSWVEGMTATKSPRCDTDNKISVMGQGTTRVTLAGVLATHIQFPRAQHAFVNVWPFLITRLSLEIGITSSTNFLVDDVNMDMQQLLR